MNKTLDLNTLIGEEKTILIGDKTYIIWDVPMSVVLLAETLWQNPKEIITLVQKILWARNDVSKEDVEKLSIKQLKALVEFTFKDLNEDDSVKKKLDEENEKLD